ncbi:MAG: hypothetical protein ACRD22_11750, partial [Terriglobia bacterium]
MSITARMPVARSVHQRPSPALKATAMSKNVRITVAVLLVVLPVMLFVCAFGIVKFFIATERFEHRIRDFSFSSLPAARIAPDGANLFITQEKDRQTRDWFHLDLTGQEHFDHGRLREAEKSFREALAVASKLPPNRQPAFTIATMDELIEVLQAQGSFALTQLSQQVKQREKYANDHGLSGKFSEAKVDESLAAWRSKVQLSSADLQRLQAIANAETDVSFAHKMDSRRFAALRRIDQLVKQYLSHDEDLQLKLDAALGDLCCKLGNISSAQYYYNKSFDQLKLHLAAHPDVGMVSIARTEATFCLSVAPAKALALCEFAMQGAKHNADDKAYMADAMALDAR